MHFPYNIGFITQIRVNALIKRIVPEHIRHKGCSTCYDPVFSYSRKRMSKREKTRKLSSPVVQRNILISFFMLGNAQDNEFYFFSLATRN